MFFSGSADIEKQRNFKLPYPILKYEAVSQFLFSAKISFFLLEGVSKDNPNTG